uniref:Uncharacterized protein n=1 Tax=Cacopsylla melanoneura TaxID=428564 RepID=A0A8D8X5E4_9HEMI
MEYFPGCVPSFYAFLLSLSSVSSSRKKIPPLPYSLFPISSLSLQNPSLRAFFLYLSPLSAFFFTLSSCSFPFLSDIFPSLLSLLNLNSNKEVQQLTVGFLTVMTYNV